jgi:nitroimidazol reductase NimA-like FMN-containing flavoprotein (pyridoxamine 5'-phosphate oxidase superfamily)
LDHSRQVWSLLETQRYAVLSTRQEDGHPYASLVAFSASEDLTRIVFCTLRTTRKYANLSADGRVALLVDSRSNEEADLQRAAAVTVLGECQEARGGQRAALSEQLLARHPAMTDFVRSPDCAVMAVDVRSYYLVTQFQNVIELHVDGAS